MAAVLAEANRDRKARREPFGPWDFFGSIPRPAPRAMSQDEIWASIERMHAAMGGDGPKE